jgi:hypothetical protein
VLVRERAAVQNRVRKTLEGANIKPAAVATDLMGGSARQMLVALCVGQSDAEAMAQLARGRLREKIPQLEPALVGDFRPHQRFLPLELGGCDRHVAALRDPLNEDTYAAAWAEGRAVALEQAMDDARQD